MIAARLGNKANRQDFLSRFWYAEKSEKKDVNDPFDCDGLGVLLKEYEHEIVDWPQAVRQFKEAIKQEQALRSKRTQIFNNLILVQNLKKEITSTQSKLKKGQKEVDILHNLIQDMQRQYDPLQEVLDENEHESVLHAHFVPSFLEKILTLGKAYTQWRTRSVYLRREIEKYRILLKKLNEKFYLAQENLNKTLKNNQYFQNVLENKVRDIALKNLSFEEGQQFLGKHYPDLDNWIADPYARELSSPWLDTAWNEARANVFSQALNLHHAFILSNAETMHKNLSLCMNILGNTLPKETPQDAIEAAWTTLFFVVPVVSTTFASFDRLFSHLEKESLGWLLIDEAGQATPQAAIGAVWRSKRVVIVGDPMQLEPILSCPQNLQEALRDHYETDHVWMPSLNSLQELADRVNPLGTYIKTQIGHEAWIGLPLRVHRRCDLSIFQISNKIAYDGLMVFGTPPRPELNLPESAWFDIKSTQSQGHWIPDEGKMVTDLLDTLIEKNIMNKNIYLISPFRDVIKNLKQITQKYNGINVGTIHTVQGKEADIVLLVLGSDPNKKGAKIWASSKPNLLNVAASRAKHRLYVIGDRSLWSKYPYFKTLNGILPIATSLERSAAA